MSKFLPDPPDDHDGIDRRGFLNCMAWAGTGLLVSLAGGVARSQSIAGKQTAKGDLQFVQISDSHIGFSKDANKNVAATLQAAVDRINALPEPPAFLLHTGDITHLSKPEEFDTAQQILKGCKAGEIFYVPGEHDVLAQDGRSFLDRFGKDTRGDGWYSFDQKGVHFIGLVNVMNLKPGGLGALGHEQLEWLEKDLKGHSKSTPIVVFAHVPLWTVYQDWGWGTEDGMQALGYMKKFGSVTVLNGHIHQTMQKVEGNITFHTATSTAFPQPKPGAAPSPGPMTVPADQLRGLLGLTQVNYVRSGKHLAIIDSTLADSMSADSARLAEDVSAVSVGRSAAAGSGAGNGAAVQIDNFSFAPNSLKIARGSEVTWTNHDDIPHNVVAADKSFSSQVLDTNEKFTHRFSKAGDYSYFCSLHPKMTGKLVVVE
jgi:Icc protein